MASAPGKSATAPPHDPNREFVTAFDSPAALAAITKAITGSYLSSGGNAFSSRTASEIVQDTFPPNPATINLGSGPLFGVQMTAHQRANRLRDLNGGGLRSP